MTFSTPIKTTVLKVEFEPQPGITAVIGRNGSGKSWSVLEVPRFLLFGKKALRGAAGDYKTMEAHGVFTLRGTRVTIERNAKRERVTDAAGTILAVGAEAVTAKVTELLGYGLDVFDLANASVQKQTDKLGQLRPAQRKELIDRVVGLADYEAVEKACREEAKGYRREAEALAKVLRAPGTEPVKPESKATPDMIRAAIQLHVDVEGQWANWNAQVYRGMPPLQPMMPRTERAEMLRVEQQEQERLATAAEARRLDAILARTKMAPVQEISESVLIAAEARNQAKRAIANRGPAPRYGREETEKLWAAWAVFDAYEPSAEVECPSCGTSFRPTGEPPLQPDVSKDTLRDDGDRQTKCAHGAEISLPAGPDMTSQQIKAAREINAAAAQYREADAARAALPSHTDQSSLLAAMRGAVPAWAVYDEKLAEHTRRVAASHAAEKALATLGPRPTPEELEALQKNLSEAEGYARDLARYEADVIEFDRVCDEIERISVLAENFKAGGEALLDARATLKAHLAPLWSRVASSLIYDMTAGELTSVVVDDDMEITVDGQRIETLSGAGETVANLALRIGLGQVLVAESFPVFLGDEIDSDADEQRRAATKLAIASLRKRLTQIILVSHRQIDIADDVLDLDQAN